MKNLCLIQGFCLFLLVTIFSACQNKPVNMTENQDSNQATSTFETGIKKATNSRQDSINAKPTFPMGKNQQRRVDIEDQDSFRVLLYEPIILYIKEEDFQAP